MNHRTCCVDQLSDLRTHEPEILAAIASTQWGAHRFLADPLRFLGEVGFTVGDAFADWLRCSLPELPNASDATYQEIRAGRHPWCRHSVAVASLALPCEEGAP